MPSRTLKILSIVALISLGAFKCTDDTPAPLASENPFCVAQQPIISHWQDTKQTILEIRRMNVRWCSICAPQRPDCARLLKSLEPSQ